MALSRLDNLYRQMILEHADHPHHHGVLENSDHQLELRNPTCGDAEDGRRQGFRYCIFR